MFLRLWGPLLCYWICLFHLCYASDLVDWSFEEGVPAWFKCGSSNVINSLHWQLFQNGDFVNVSSCNIQDECTDFMSPRYRSSVTKDGPGTYAYLMTVHLNSVSRNETRFRCRVDARTIGESNLDVFTPPYKPSCDSVTLVDSNRKANITCRTKRVMPRAVYSLMYSETSLPVGPEGNDVCKTYPSLSDPDYNMTECTTLISLSSLEPDTYQFYANMYPDTVNTTKGLQHQIRGADTDVLELTAPKVSLSYDCPVASSKTSSTCRCELTTVGNPPGQARWYTKTGQVVGSEDAGDGSSTLTVSYHPSDPAPSYECRAVTTLKMTSPSTVTFTPTFPSGPSSVIIETSDDGKFNLCPMQQHTTTVTCKVAFDDVDPQVDFTISVNGNVVVESKNGRPVAGHYVQDYSFRPTAGGNHRVTCTAQNSLFPEMAVTESVDIDVREPPPLAPEISVLGNQRGSKVATVIAGRQVDITCRVDGGDPQVSEVTIICGSRSQEGQGKITTLVLDVIEALDGLICYCAARHDSDCYDEESEVTLQVKDPAKSGRDSDEDDEDNLGLIIGLSVASVIPVALVILFIVLYKKHQTPAKKEDKPYDQARVRSADSNGYIIPVSGDYQVILDDSVSSHNSGTGDQNDDGGYSNISFFGSNNV